jgi:hypothetical protein
MTQFDKITIDKGVQTIPLTFSKVRVQTDNPAMSHKSISTEIHTNMKDRLCQTVIPDMKSTKVMTDEQQMTDQYVNTEHPSRHAQTEDIPSQDKCIGMECSQETMVINPATLSTDACQNEMEMGIPYTSAAGNDGYDICEQIVCPLNIDEKFERNRNTDRVSTDFQEDGTVDTCYDTEEKLKASFSFSFKQTKLDELVQGMSDKLTAIEMSDQRRRDRLAKSKSEFNRSSVT